MPWFEHDSIEFHYREAGTGLPFVFQHGLGGDVSQPFGLFTPPRGVRLLGFDCRAHGETHPVGPDEKIGIGSFAGDLAAFLDHQELDRAVIGGISMGAAVTINFALRWPERVLGLVQSRPAWLEGPNLENAEKLSYLAALLREHGPERGRDLFQQSNLYRQLLQESTDVAASLCGQFDSPYAAERAGRLERIPRDAPYETLDQVGEISVPTLVLANRHDPVHPFAFGEALAEAIPLAELHEITAKSVDGEQHGADVQRHVTEFLQTHFV